MGQAHNKIEQVNSIVTNGISKPFILDGKSAAEEGAKATLSEITSNVQSMPTGQGAAPDASSSSSSSSSAQSTKTAGHSRQAPMPEPGTGINATSGQRAKSSKPYASSSPQILANELSQVTGSVITNIIKDGIICSVNEMK